MWEKREELINSASPALGEAGRKVSMSPGGGKHLGVGGKERRRPEDPGAFSRAGEEEMAKT